MMSSSQAPRELSMDDLRTGEWRLDRDRSSVEFRVPHFWGVVTVKGHFGRFRGTLDLQAEPAVRLTIKAESLDTGNRRRDRHLRSADFFDVEHHPQLWFVSDSVSVHGDVLKVQGALHARGNHIPLEVDARVRPVHGGLTIEAEARACHRDLGMTWSPLKMTRPYSTLAVTGRLIRGRASGPPEPRPPR